MCKTVLANLKLIVRKFVYERQFFFIFFFVIHQKSLAYKIQTLILPRYFFPIEICYQNNQGQCDFIHENVYFGIIIPQCTVKKQ